MIRFSSPMKSPLWIKKLQKSDSLLYKQKEKKMPILQIRLMQDSYALLKCEKVFIILPCWMGNTILDLNVSFTSFKENS